MKKYAAGVITAFKKIIPKEEKHKKLILLSGVAVLLLIVVIITAVSLSDGNREGTTYKETQAVIGKLTIGVTETGSVDVGTTTQSFDLNISEFTGESTFTLEGMDGRMNFTMQMGGNSSSGNQSADSRQLVVEEVYVKDGQEIAKGSPLIKLTQESVNSIRIQLAEDLAEAKNVYDQMLTVQKQDRQEAEGQLKMNTLYGIYAQAEYDQSVHAQQENVEEKEEALIKAEEILAEGQQELSEKQALLKEEKQVFANAEYTVNDTDRETNLYWWIIAVQARDTAREMVDTLTGEIEELEEKIKGYFKSVTEAGIALELARKQLETSTIQDTKLGVKIYSAENAQAIYDLSIAQSDFNTEKAKADYEEAEGKLSDFDAMIVEQIIYADYNGLITETAVKAGDALTQDMDLIILNDYDEITITLSVEEDDMAAAVLGNQANVTIGAFPEEVFRGIVTEIGDAEIDSNTNKTIYTVTVTVANTNHLLYQDMTAEVTLITEESAEVLYVPNKAILQEGDTVYVKVRGENGEIGIREVVTGFTDGICTEIKEGISKGETVLWESRVKSK